MPPSPIQHRHHQNESQVGFAIVTTQPQLSIASCVTTPVLPGSAKPPPQLIQPTQRNVRRRRHDRVPRAVLAMDAALTPRRYRHSFNEHHQPVAITSSINSSGRSPRITHIPVLDRQDHPASHGHRAKVRPQPQGSSVIRRRVMPVLTLVRTPDPETILQARLAWAMRQLPAQFLWYVHQSRRQPTRRR